jgi:hypothetical protein
MPKWVLPPSNVQLLKLFVSEICLTSLSFEHLCKAYTFHLPAVTMLSIIQTLKPLALSNASVSEGLLHHQYSMNFQWAGAARKMFHSVEGIYLQLAFQWSTLQPKAWYINTTHFTKNDVHSPSSLRQRE